MNGETRIYVADLAAYNSGTLRGVWVDATDDTDDIEEQINQMLVKSPIKNAEAFAIHAVEGFDGCNIGECTPTSKAHEIACFIEEFPGYGAPLLGRFGDNIEEARQWIEDKYLGCYKSLADYAEETNQEHVNELPENLRLYIDYERMAHDWECNGSYTLIEESRDCVHIFLND